MTPSLVELACSRGDFLIIDQPQHWKEIWNEIWNWQFVDQFANVTVIQITDLDFCTSEILHFIWCFTFIQAFWNSGNVRTANNFLWASYWRHTLQNMSRFEGHPQLILTRKETWKKEQNFWESIPTVRITLETFMIFMIFLQTMQRF